MFTKRTNWKLDENAYTLALCAHRASGQAIFDLTASNPTTCGFQYDERAILSALSAPTALYYDPEPKGLLSARQAVADYYREKSPGASINPERIILTTGTSEAYSFLFRLLCEPGDDILIAHPSYPLFDFLATIQDVQLRAFDFVYDHGWQIDFESLRKAIGPRTRAVLLVHPNNPTGHCISTNEAAELNGLCAKHQLALIVDEVFLDYEMRPTSDQSAYKQRHGSFAANQGTLTFVLSGLSKIAALPQMKVGWIVASGPDEMVNDAIRRLEFIADTYLSLNTPVQAALPVLLAQRTTIQPQIMTRVEANLRMLGARIAQQKLVSRLEIEGGWYAVLRVPSVQADEALAIQLLENQSVLVHPGHFYDFPDRGYLIVSLLTPIDEFAEGARRLLEFIAGGQGQ